MRNAPSRWLAGVNLALAALAVAAIAWCFHIAREAAEDAVRTYGHNVDSGAYLIIFAIIYLAPPAILLTLAGFAFWRSWRVRWYIEGAVVLWFAAVMYRSIGKS
jgi:hypothetical protein